MSNTGDLTSHTPIPSKPTTPRPSDHPAASLHKEIPLPLTTATEPKVEAFKVKVDDPHSGYAHGFLHLPADSSASGTAAILISGAGGGVVGPSAMYLSLARTLPLLPSGGIPTLRLDYRYPARTGLCVADTKAAMAYLTEQYNVKKFVLVGWSFGGAPVYTLAGHDERVIGAATIASQTADALTGAREAGRRGVPVLLLHGTGDRILSHRCSQNLYDAWLYTSKDGDSTDQAQMVLFEGDDHALTKNAAEAARLVGDFIARCAGSVMGKENETVLAAGLDRDKGVLKEVMVKGGDLRGKESMG